MMPDRSVMLQFAQATGPTAGWRPRAAARVRDCYSVPNDGYDMTGLAQENVYLRSVDHGRSWTRVSSDPFASVGNGCVNGGTAIDHGHVLRSVWGQCLPFWDVPQNGYLQRSTDGARTWSPPEPLCADDRMLAWPKRLRMLSDGRIVVTGGISRHDGDEWKWMDACETIRPCLWISEDGEGRHWSPPLPLLDEGSAAYAEALAEGFTEEVDVAELKNGDLLAMYRTNARHASCLLRRQENTWESVQDVSTASFPQSGHPELLAVREGAVLYVSHAGTWWTADDAHWTSLSGVPGSGYYPRSVQLDDGTIMVIGHIGYDDAYGSTDQSVVMDTYRLNIE